jgi:hypothetical protein
MSDRDDRDDEPEVSGGWFNFGTSVERLDDEEFAEKLDPEARAWFQTHEVSLDEGTENAEATDDSGRGGGGIVAALANRVPGVSTGSTTEPDHPSPTTRPPADQPSPTTRPPADQPSPTTGSTPDESRPSESGATTGESAERGTLVFPADEQFMQSLEIRAKNGAQRRVETVYALTGPTYTAPTDLFALDDPEFYESATRRSVVTLGGRMARAVARRFPDGETPNLVARFHTHPGGTTTPSDTDQESAADVYEGFTEAFDSAEFEFFQGIHAYAELSEPGSRSRDPHAVSNTVSWEGEQYRHTLALYGPQFRNAREVQTGDAL